MFTNLSSSSKDVDMKLSLMEEPCNFTLVTGESIMKNGKSGEEQYQGGRRQEERDIRSKVGKIGDPEDRARKRRSRWSRSRGHPIL